MRIVFVGGGTGGHFYPLMAVAEVLKDSPEKPELYYVGPEPYNQNELSANRVIFVFCPAGKVRRYFTIQNIFDIFRIIGGMFVAFYKLYHLYPDVIFSKGGYTSVPILLLARFYRIPVVIHESDSKPGRANVLAKNFARAIGIAYDEVAPFFPEGKTALIGIPIRKSIAAITTDPFTVLGIPDDMPLVYVTGGSLGAERINALRLSSLQNLLPYYRVFHQTGAPHEQVVTQTAQALVEDKSLLQRYYVRGTITAEAVSALLDAATIVISRAGSTSLAEIAIHGKPSIIIPIPEEVSHDQRTNAYSYARSGAASVLEEKNLTPHLLTAEIQSIIGNPEKYKVMKQAAAAVALPNAAEKVAALLISIGIEHGS